MTPRIASTYPAMMSRRVPGPAGRPDGYVKNICPPRANCRLKPRIPTAMISPWTGNPAGMQSLAVR
jgi:hypothetical protein